MAKAKRTKIPAQFLARALACQLRIRIGLRLVRLIRAHLGVKTHHRIAEIVRRRVLFTLPELKTLLPTSSRMQQAARRGMIRAFPYQRQGPSPGRDSSLSGTEG
jgi:hypothetical protein